jgi:hypothetical protein
MKWVTKQQQLEDLFNSPNHQGLKYRTITKFLFFPKTIGGERRWFSKETIIQKVAYDIGGLTESGFYYWQSLYWFNDDLEFLKGLKENK